MDARSERDARSDCAPNLVEARQADAVIAARIDDAVAHSNFAAAGLPNFSAALPDPQQVLRDLGEMAARAEVDERAHGQLRDALAELEADLGDDTGRP